ncbi:MAG: transcription antitermination factor NusB [Clostridia bacterium]|nr:transcription antitermination factor NusB [Clostridia bacterium]
MSRKVAREVAMKLVFAKLAGGEDTYEAVLEKSGIDAEPAAEDVAYANEIISGIEAHAEEIDALIDDIAIGWKIERMPRVDLSILRIAIYEMQYRDDIPCSVSINEAVELAKEFGGEKSSSYINGMLGTLAKRIEDAPV